MSAVTACISIVPLLRITIIGISGSTCFIFQNTVPLQPRNRGPTVVAEVSGEGSFFLNEREEATRAKVHSKSKYLALFRKKVCLTPAEIPQLYDFELTKKSPVKIIPKTSGEGLDSVQKKK